MRKVLALLVMITLLPPPIEAQSNRLRAVAIDRVPIPPPDTLEVERVGPPLRSPWSIAVLAERALLIPD